MINDHVLIHDEVEANGVLFKGDTSQIIGEVEVLYNSEINGKKLFTRKIYKNDLLVTGSVFFAEKVNSTRSTFLTTPLDLEYGVHTAEEIIRDHTTIPNEKICGIMVGNGGAGDTYNTVYKVNRAARSVPGVLPLRVVPVNDDLSATDREKYFMRVVKGDYAYYYGKKFDIDRALVVEYEDGTTVPVDVDVMPTSKFIKIYTRYRVTIDQRDIREYFKITQGSTLRSLINSIGLVSGYPGQASDNFEEFYNVRGITTVNMENQELKDSASTITIIYRQFIQ